jgi:hypothetical protein
MACWRARVCVWCGVCVCYVCVCVWVGEEGCWDVGGCVWRCRWRTRAQPLPTMQPPARHNMRACRCSFQRLSVCVSTKNFCASCISPRSIVSTAAACACVWLCVGWGAVCCVARVLHVVLVCVGGGGRGECASACGSRKAARHAGHATSEARRRAAATHLLLVGCHGQLAQVVSQPLKAAAALGRQLSTCALRCVVHSELSRSGGGSSSAWPGASAARRGRAGGGQVTPRAPHCHPSPSTQPTPASQAAQPTRSHTCESVQQGAVLHHLCCQRVQPPLRRVGSTVNIRLRVRGTQRETHTRARRVSWHGGSGPLTIAKATLVSRPKNQTHTHMRAHTHAYTHTHTRARTHTSCLPPPPPPLTPAATRTSRMSSHVFSAYSRMSGARSSDSSARRRSAYTRSRCVLTTWS